jgi:hypothetical protein
MNRSIDRALVHHYVSETVCESPAFEVGGQTIQRLVERRPWIMPGCSMCSRVPSENQLHLVIDTLVHRKVAPAIGLLAVAAPHSPVRVTSCLCVYHRGRLVIHNNLEQQMPVFMRCSSSS